MKNNDIDYIGTRLHAGIYAMQNKRRSIILIVDNRARDMKKTYNLVAVERDDIQQLNKIINTTIKTNIKINENYIKEWKEQFK